ncbi:uncharacterized protein A1O9_08167 [Exophiala aquamarina CBS 119918]|uniref:Uncharacterized protein n=1 Tax=Exophiala aquamarina CBS 119918 TaxID=1182545 RepID=A0A072P6R3_9EURO|nr:uncharacterized protein A1O9_08167 [Exophiala aquamarina CBS 119918]KEF55417.1 hypothetical protein A1O9_08167 [Exophiala aquamarina CBS 119918]
MTIRNSNVYEDHSLGLYTEDLSWTAQHDEAQPIEKKQIENLTTTTTDNRIISGFRRTVALSRGRHPSHQLSPHGHVKSSSGSSCAVNLDTTCGSLE